MKDTKEASKEGQQSEPTNGELEKESIVIPVVEESVHLDRKVIETGKVTVSKKTVEHEETVEGTFKFDDIQVERVEINEYIKDQPPGVRHEGDTMIVPVYKEVLVVEKRLLLVEELHITKRQTEKPYHTTVILRKEEVTVSRSDPDSNSTLSDKE
ncbi:YsnF/AvaK domain-containing protein [Telluribacter humicola]|uniref:YsnF/AvaK domain-containing protein n=1 Tax=Telluribacter humicola TaxID=1720261 RepID=UPI001A96E6F8|nr:YsnF/AvaK domain-containing protein [Telluribacter humicola]